MKHVCESLQDYKIISLFKRINEEKKEITKDDVKVEKEKLAAEEQKDIDAIMKRLEDNFSTFKIAAKDKFSMWKDFVYNNLLKEKLAPKSIETAEEPSQEIETTEETPVDTTSQEIPQGETEDMEMPKEEITKTPTENTEESSIESTEVGEEKPMKESLNEENKNKKIKAYKDVKIGDIAYENPDAGGEWDNKIGKVLWKGDKKALLKSKYNNLSKDWEDFDETADDYDLIVISDTYGPALYNYDNDPSGVVIFNNVNESLNEEESVSTKNEATVTELPGKKCYKFWNSNIIACISTNEEGKECLKFIEDGEELFITCNSDAVKRYKKFYENVLLDIKNYKETIGAAKELEQKEKQYKEKRTKINKILKA